MNKGATAVLTPFESGLLSPLRNPSVAQGSLRAWDRAILLAGPPHQLDAVAASPSRQGG